MVYCLCFAADGFSNKSGLIARAKMASLRQLIQAKLSPGENVVVVSFHMHYSFSLYFCSQYLYCVSFLNVSTGARGESDARVGANLTLPLTS